MRATAAMTTVGLCLEPLDVLFFRDGRPFTGSERSVSGLPLPQTLAGTIRTALLRSAGCDFVRLKEAVSAGAAFDQAVLRSCAEECHWVGQVIVRGPWLARCTDGNEDIEILVPMPAILHREKRGNAAALHRLAPLRKGQLPSWNPREDQQELQPLWIKHLVPTEPANGFLTPGGLTKFLNSFKVYASDIVPVEDLLGLDYRTGIGISPDRLVAAESQIFGRGFLSLKQNIFLYGEVELPDDAPNGSLFDQLGTLPLGGEGRHVVLRRLPKPFAWPHAQPPSGSQKSLVLLTTPCVFQAGWKPHFLEGNLVAAAVPDSLPFSGWDLARGGPKPTRFAVPAGSVYFLKSFPNDWAQTLAENDEDHQQGWGCCLTGVWTDE